VLETTRRGKKRNGVLALCQKDEHASVQRRTRRADERFMHKAHNPRLAASASHISKRRRDAIVKDANDVTVFASSELGIAYLHKKYYWIL